MSRRRVGPNALAVAAIVLLSAAAGFWAGSRFGGEAPAQGRVSESAVPIGGLAGLDDAHPHDGQWIADEAQVLIERDPDSAQASVAADSGGAGASSAEVPAESEAHAVVSYRDGVFSPQRVDISVGGTVTFRNDDELLVWPASNIHPTHEILPEFDPLGPIGPGEWWSHTFTKAGYWRYHNHSAAEEVGIVVVADDDSGLAPPLPAVFDLPQWPAPPQGDAVSFGLQAEDTLAEFVDQYGPEHAIRLMSLHEFQSGWHCHDMAHVAGRRAYENWGAGVITLAVHECRNGLMHGAMEALFADRGTARLQEDILALCQSLDDSFQQYNCMHGIGHGLMAWTSYEIHEALDLCGLSPSAWLADSCATGVFMENVVGGLSGAIGHTSEWIDADDPVLPCNVVDERWLRMCWMFQTSHALDVIRGDWAELSDLCLVQPQSVHEACFGSIGRDLAATQMPADIIVGHCSHGPVGNLQESCLTGAAQTKFWDAAGAEQGIAVCNAGRQAGIGPNGCYDYLTDRAVSLLTDDAQRETLCSLIAVEEAAARCRAKLVGAAAR